MYLYTDMESIYNVRMVGFHMTIFEISLLLFNPSCILSSTLYSPLPPQFNPLCSTNLL